MHDLSWAKALLFYGCLPGLAFIGGFFFSRWYHRRQRRNRALYTYGSRYL